MIESSIISSHTIHDITQVLSDISEKAVIFVDVDDTLITPQSKLFRWTSSYRTLIDDLKEKSEQHPNFEDIISHWRSTRKSMLICEEWPEFLQELQKHFKVYALTKMNSGTIGRIPSMEEWRYEELKSKGITFTSLFNGMSKTILFSENSEKNPSSFYEGIFITGAYPKSAVIRNYLKENAPDQIIFIDDRTEYLQDVQQECEKQNIPFIGIHYKGMENLDGTPDPEVAAFQKRSLFEDCRWYEDEEAEKRIK